MRKKINLDICRFFASFLIVAIHISPFAKINPEFDFFFTRILGRVAVPFFVMITGYYVLDKSFENKKVLIDYTKKILKIYLFCMILYLPINIYQGTFENFDGIEVVKDVFINGTMYHLWYFPALIVGIWLTYYLIKKLGRKASFIIILLFYLIGLFGDSYYGIIVKSEIAKNIYHFLFHLFEYTRNGLFYIPIFLYLGYAIKITPRNIRCPFLYNLLFFLLMSGEAFLLHRYHLQRHDSMYLFLLPLMYFFFCYLIEHHQTANRKLRNVATSIYIFHPLFIIGIRFVSGRMGIQNILLENNLLFYLLVCLITAVFAILIEKIKGVGKNERKSFGKE